MVFAKTPLANRSLTAQFTARSVRKKYLLLTDRPVRQSEFTVKSALVRAGERYSSRPVHAAERRRKHVQRTPRTKEGREAEAEASRRP